MLKINPDPSFTTEIDITVPGSHETAKVSLTFKYKNKKDLLEFWQVSEGKGDESMIGEIVTGWEGFDVGFTPENLKTFLNNYPAAPYEIMMAYQGLLLESRIKN